MSSLQQFGGDWTEIKLEKVCTYLQQYTTALKNQREWFRLTYIDGFAGTGWRTLRDAAETSQLHLEELKDEQPKVLDGSARLALQVDPPFDDFIFIEKDPKNFAELECLKYQNPEQDIRVVNQDANTFLQGYCNKSWSGHRAVLFLDPFGCEVTWETIQCIAKTQAIDLWLLFPLDGVMRMLKNNGQIDETWKACLNTLFGSDDWYGRFYQEDSQQQLPLLGLSDEPQLVKTADYQGITNYLVERLRSVFPTDGIVDKPMMLYNSKNHPLFLLCFAAGNPKGAPIAKRIAQAALGS
jgi:three-Cys-motif partner protein